MSALKQGNRLLSDLGFGWRVPTFGFRPSVTARMNAPQEEGASDSEELLDDFSGESETEGSPTVAEPDCQAVEGAPRPQAIYKSDELHEKLEDVLWENATFFDTQVAESRSDGTVGDIDDDLQRELCFYNQAVAGAKSAVQRLEKAGLPWLRPTDYYAEMVKSDGHMLKVKEQLMFEQKRLEETEQRRKQREAKRINKAVQAARLKEKAQSRKQNISKVEQLRKQRQQSGFGGDFDVEAELSALEQPTPTHTGQRIVQGKNRVSKKREAKNSRYGFGGRKRIQKQNDASSAANMESYRGNRSGRGGKRKGLQRPGKARRAAGKARH